MVILNQMESSPRVHLIAWQPHLNKYCQKLDFLVYDVIGSCWLVANIFRCLYANRRAGVINGYAPGQISK